MLLRGWKRRLALALSVAFCFACFSGARGEPLRGYTREYGWQYLELGVYPQTMEAGMEPILWRVLSVDQNEAYLVSEYVLLNRRVHSDDTEYVLSGGSFEATEMFAFLNGTFLQSFSADEKDMLADHGTEGRVTLLSADDLRDASLGFGTNASRTAYGTPYAVQNGLFQYSLQHGNSSPYWTRTQNAGAKYAACCTKAEGNIGWIRVVVQNEGCRPACSVRMDKILIEQGDGTRQNPFRLKLNKGSVEQ